MKGMMREAKRGGWFFLPLGSIFVFNSDVPAKFGCSAKFNGHSSSHIGNQKELGRLKSPISSVILKLQRPIPMKGLGLSPPPGT